MGHQANDHMKLYSYWRSSAAYRVRIALNIKSITHEIVPVHLVKGGGEHNSRSYLEKNPQGLVPSLELDDGSVLTQSLAMLEYLEEICPKPALLPTLPLERAKVRAVVGAVCCDIHPLNNLRVLKYLKNSMGQEQDDVSHWYAHWVRQGGLLAVEKLLAGAGSDGPWAFGEKPGMADVAIIPQLYNARRFGIDIGDCPRLVEIKNAAADNEAFVSAAPENQIDAE